MALYCYLKARQAHGTGCHSSSMAGRGGLRKIIESVVTRDHILKLKCTKFAGELTALPRLAGFKRPTSKGKEEKRGQ